MLTIVFLAFVALFLVSGIFISLEAIKKSRTNPASGASHRREQSEEGRGAIGND